MTLVACGPFLPHAGTPNVVGDCDCLAGPLVVILSGHSLEWMKEATKGATPEDISERLAELAGLPRDAILAISDGFESGYKASSWDEEFRPLFEMARELRAELNPPDYWALRQQRTKELAQKEATNAVP